MAELQCPWQGVQCLGCHSQSNLGRSRLLCICMWPAPGDPRSNVAAPGRREEHPLLLWADLGSSVQWRCELSESDGLTARRHLPCRLCPPWADSKLHLQPLQPLLHEPCFSSLVSDTPRPSLYCSPFSIAIALWRSSLPPPPRHTFLQPGLLLSPALTALSPHSLWA